MKYRADIDGLRAVAVMAVVLHHLSSTLVPGGYIGVDVFFVISGYLITKIIGQEIEEGRFTFTRFYERRIRRLFPALFAMLAATLVAGWFLLLPSDYVATLRAALGTVLFSSNIVFWKDMAAGYFASDAKLNPLLHTWSLAVEEQFYLLFPILLLLCFRYASRYLVAVLLACAFITLVASSLLVKGHEVAVFFLSPFRFWELLAGSLLAVKAVPDIDSRITRELVAGAGLLAIAVSAFVYDTKTVFPGMTALAPVVGTVAILHAGGSGSTFVGRILSWHPVVYIGLISYSLYLWHWPLIVLTRFAIGMQPLAPYLPTLLLTSIVLGGLSYHFIEQPFRHGNSVHRNKMFAAAVVAAVALLSVSVFGLARSGSPGRFDLQVIALDKARKPEIPYRECDSHKDWCRIGAKGVEPTVLLWGDSHMLAWAPALDRVYAKQGKGAILAIVSACPPILGVERDRSPNCFRSNEKVFQFLHNTPTIETIVLAAYWSTYFAEQSSLSDINPKLAVLDEMSAAVGLKRTFSKLSSLGRKVYVLGPVPVYDLEVPVGLALEHMQQRKLLSMTMQMHRAKHRDFYKINETGLDPGIQFVDPEKWMCRPNCIVLHDVTLYRDAHHLSVAGSLYLLPNLEASLADKHDLLENGESFQAPYLGFEELMK